MAVIIFVRHGESEGNINRVLSGQAHLALTEKGREQARETANKLRHIKIHKAYVSQLLRAKETLGEIQQQLGLKNIPVVSHAALNERDFGSITNRPKEDIKNELGERAYADMVSGWHTAAPDGESLEMVYARSVPYLRSEIIAEAKAGKNIIVVSHHQTLRTLVKFLDDISHDKIAELKLKNAEAIIYEVAADGESLRRLPV